VIERVEVAGGEGTVLRYGSVVAWTAPSASPALVSFLAQSARNLGPSPRAGRQMADHVAAVLAVRDPEPRVGFVILGPNGEGWVSLVHGPAQLWDGRRWFRPDAGLGWVIADLASGPSAMAGAAAADSPAPSPDSMLDLEAGVVPGGGFVVVSGRGVAPPLPHGPLHGAGAPPAGERGDQTELLPLEPTVAGRQAVPDPVARPAQPAPAPAEPEAAPADFLRDDCPTETLTAGTPTATPTPTGTVDLRPSRDPSVPARPPLALGRGPHPSLPGSPAVAGVLCPRGHVNRPASTECVRCASPVPPDSAYTASGTRPALGVLMTDDGLVYRLDRGYLVGSDPYRDPTVRSGLSRPLLLRSDEVSGSHAEIRLHDWDVVVTDRASNNGTSIYPPGAARWQRLRPFEEVVLAPGTHVAFGPRIVTFVTRWVGQAAPSET
jgi:hypothetical protein